MQRHLLFFLYMEKKMKKSIVHTLILLLSIGLLAACNAPQSEEKVIKKKAQVYAEKYITAQARRCFDKPLSIKISDVWFLDVTEPDKNTGEMKRHFYFFYKVENDGIYEYYSNYFSHKYHAATDESTYYYVESLDDFDFVGLTTVPSDNIPRHLENAIFLDAGAVYKYYLENLQ